MEIRERSGKKDRLLFEKIKNAAGPFGGVICFLCSFILSDAELLGCIRPFGICYAASREEGIRPWAYMGAFLGSLLTHGRDGLTYCAAVITLLTIDLIVLEKSQIRELLVPPVTAAVIFIIKAPFAFYGGMGSVLLLILEGLLTAWAGYCLRAEDRDVRRMAVSLGFMAAFASMSIFELISPSAVFAVTASMAAVYMSSSFRGAAAGLAAGAVYDMALDMPPFFTWVIGIASAALSLTGRKSRVGFALLFLGAGTACAAWGMGDSRAMGCIYDLFTGTSVFLLLPDSWLMPPWHEEAEQKYPMPGEGLERLRKVMETVSKSIGRQIDREKNRSEDICVIFDKASASVCRSCPNASLCWMEHYGDTLGWMCDMLPVIREKGRIKPEDMGEAARSMCIKKDMLCGAVNLEYMAYLRRRSAEEREKEKDILLKEQYEGLSAAVGGLAQSVNSAYAPAPVYQKRVRDILRAYSRRLGAEVFSVRGRLNIRVGVFDEDEPWEDEEAFLRSVTLSLEKDFLKGERIPYRDGEAVLYREKESLRASASCAVRKKKGEELCGDSHIWFSTEEGRAVFMISDGMGTGKEASCLSRNALELMCAFIKSGCSLTESAAAVLPLLKARYGFEGFATLDALEVELFTGRAVMIKCGAPDSLLIRNGEGEAISGPSLPPGAGGSVRPRPIELQLRQGDRIIMSSDGAEPAACAQLLRDSVTASEIMDICGGGGDDATVMNIRIESNKEQEEGES